QTEGQLGEEFELLVVVEVGIRDRIEAVAAEGGVAAEEGAPPGRTHVEPAEAREQRDLFRQRDLHADLGAGQDLGGLAAAVAVEPAQEGVSEEGAAAIAGSETLGIPVAVPEQGVPAGALQRVLEFAAEEVQTLHGRP